MSEYWFRPKTYGYGATPVSWKGWAAVGGYLAVILAITLPLTAWPADMPDSPKIWQLITWAIMVTALTLAFIRFTRAKTDGQWTWRWGK
jgi:hypothetical protein